MEGIKCGGKENAMTNTTIEKLESKSSRLLQRFVERIISDGRYWDDDELGKLLHEARTILVRRADLVLDLTVERDVYIFLDLTNTEVQEDLWLMFFTPERPLADLREFVDHVTGRSERYANDHCDRINAVAERILADPYATIEDMVWLEEYFSQCETYHEDAFHVVAAERIRSMQAGDELADHKWNGKPF